MHKIFVGTPTHDGKVTSQYLESFRELEKTLQECGYSVDLVLETSSILHMTRNMMATCALDRQFYEGILFIDADMRFDAESVIKILESRREVIGIAYPRRQLPLMVDRDEMKSLADKDGPPKVLLSDIMSPNLDYAVRPSIAPPGQDIVQVDQIGCGLLFIRRSALEKLKNTMTNYKVAPEHSPTWFGLREFWGFFDYERHEDHCIGEDYSFCLRWTGAGGTIYALSSADVGHVGPVEVHGRYADTRPRRGAD